jgi:predicted GNAT family N-acyltransferase
MDFRLALVVHGSAAWHRTVRLRDTVLRAPLGLAFSADELAAESMQLHLALHVGAALAGVVVLVPPMTDGERIWKLRQMAVAQGFRGQGAGGALIAAAESQMCRRGAARAVLHAREEAVPFYVRHGYLADGEIFEEVTIPHRRMSKVFGF